MVQGRGKCFNEENTLIFEGKWKEGKIYKGQGEILHHSMNNGYIEKWIYRGEK